MENRNITIVSTQNQRKYVVNTDATTLAELKAALDAQDIDYEGMTFYEGLSHTELLTNESVLPHDVPYKGTVTNELVFMLTTPNKRIKSGASLPDTRQALYDTINEMGLKDTCVSVYGKNFTQCKNSELMSLIENAQAALAENASTEDVIEKAFRKLLDTLEDNGTLYEEEANEIYDILDNVKKEDSPSPYTGAEIDEMFEFLG